MHPDLPDFSSLRFDTMVIGTIGDEGSVIRTATCTAEEAGRIGSLWNALVADESARCHFPAFVISLLRDGQTVFSANICWQCSNMRMSGPAALCSAAAFATNTAQAQDLLALCRQLAGSVT
ncbi:hypothetical protein LXA47_22200 [Massilia sp. P8910]|uniref:hypothetical protein n=1 Tax=Massilia antarctica TaxID=2765360 RepID=UPI001E473560|nr:hypothetical protein [Massilia antarctica]MCE3606296.1 hypothetical protein [Massilia antarctica]